MMKSIALLQRRASLTRAEFHEYYESRHAPLAIRYFPFARYVRNHLVDEESIGFDTISEFWGDDMAKIASLMQTEIGEIMRADEARFMDRAAIRSGGALERHVAGSSRGPESPQFAKEVWLVRTPGGLAVEALGAALARWGVTVAAHLGDACERITLDLVSPWTAAPFSCDALLWLWLHDPGAGATAAALPVPEGLERPHIARVRSCETPPAVMATALGR
jgi:uncharacterized protein (TIGR02118 family)